MKKFVYLFGFYLFLFSQEKREGFALLKVSLGARPSALGESFTAMQNDGFSCFWNPAGISTLSKNTVFLSHNENFLQIRDEYVGSIFNTRYGSFSPYFVYSSIGQIEMRDEIDNLLPQKTGQVSSILGLGYGYSFNSLSFGISGKYLYDRIKDISGKGFSFDIGALHKTTPALSLGLALKNIGGKISYPNENFPLPLLLRIGAFLTPLKYGNILMDMEYNRQDGFNFYTGIEGWIMNIFALRMGYKSIKQENHFTFGTGFKVKEFNVDYAFMPYGVLGNTHKISMSLDFGEPKGSYTSLKIKVINEKTKLPVSIPIKLKGTLVKEIETDIQGIFYEKNVPSGHIEIEINVQNFYPKKEKFYIEKDKENTFVITLTPFSFISITGFIFDEETRAPIAGKIVYRGFDYGKTYAGKGIFQIEKIHPGEYEFEVIPEDTFYKKLYIKKKVEKNDSIIFLLKGKEIEIQTLYFETASAEILPEYFPFLNQLGEYLAHRPSVKLVLSGHTDNREIHKIYPSNQILSEKRAESVKRYLIENFKIEENRIKLTGFGSAHPVLPNTSPENMAKNRRVTIILEK